VRYIILRSKGTPPADLPVGMNDIMGIGEYKSPTNALRYLFPENDDRREANRKQGYTHIGVYSFPRGYKDDCVLQMQTTL
jgi:hypothetical protein